MHNILAEHHTRVAYTEIPVQMNNMSIVHISLSELLDKLSSHHAQAENIHLYINVTAIRLPTRAYIKHLKNS